MYQVLCLQKSSSFFCLGVSNRIFAMRQTKILLQSFPADDSLKFIRLIALGSHPSHDKLSPLSILELLVKFTYPQ